MLSLMVKCVCASEAAAAADVVIFTFTHFVSHCVLFLHVHLPIIISILFYCSPFTLSLSSLAIIAKRVDVLMHIICVQMFRY